MAKTTAASAPDVADLRAIFGRHDALRYSLFIRSWIIYRYGVVDQSQENPPEDASAFL